MPLSHHPSADVIAKWPDFTTARPMRVFVSGCLFGLPCGTDGTSYGEYALAKKLVTLPNVIAIPFCPEDFVLGTPRKIPDVHDGTGDDVLEGRARVLLDDGTDVTREMIRAAEKAASLARANSVHLALMMDVSGACGSTVIYRGFRVEKNYQRGAGVAAAAIMRAHIPVVSQRDERTLAMIFGKLGCDVSSLPFSDKLDHHERDWYRGYFKTSA